jgi:membrane-bound lytic murein transglycosylase F
MTRISILSILFLLSLSFLPSCQTDPKTKPKPIDAAALFSCITDSAINNPLRQLPNKDTKRIKSLILNPPRRVGQISEYDQAIKKTAKKIGWDWRLLASLIHQESHFIPDLESEKGAFGLMQLMPVVMERYEIDYNATPEEQIEVGGKLIQHLEKCLHNKVTDSAERVKFVLAAYNAGLGHVYDAQRLAEKYGKSPDIWEDNVDFFILNKSKPEYYNDSCCRNGYLRGTETYSFVESVLKKHKQYKLIIE